MRTLLKLAIGLVLVVLASAAVAAEAFPVTIKHVFGATTVAKPPERIVTWGLSSQDALIALGKVPVGMPTFRSEGFDHDILPWTAEGIAALGGAEPFIFDNATDIPVEQIAALKPDLILAVHSGISAEDYGRLSQIAPVIAYPGEAWTTTWQDVITMTGRAIGKPAEGEALVADLKQFVLDQAAARPQMAGKSFVTLIDYNNEIGIHSAADTRASFLASAGMVIAEKVDGAGEGELYWYPLSYELFDTIPADILIGYFHTPALADEFFSRPFVQAAPQVARGAYVKMDDRALNMAMISMSALSLRWGVPRYFDKIAAAAERVGK
jgi:iron complex transport system substrate-binding protein